MAFSTTITIEELTPSGAGLKPRVLTLRGTSLPFQGASWSSLLKVTTTWYPGNGDQATQQVIGPQDPPSHWDGEWRRTLLSREPTGYIDESGELHELVEPFDIRRVFEDIQRKGALLRVTMETRGTTLAGDPADRDQRPVNARLVREGRCTSFDTPIARHTDVKWSMAWDWVGRGIKRQPASGARKDPDLAEASADVEAAVDQMKAIVEGQIARSDALVRGSANRFTLGRLESVATQVVNAANQCHRRMLFYVGKFKQVARISQKLVRTPLAVANSTIDFARNTMYVANQYIAEQGRVPPEVASLKGSVADLLRAARYRQRTADAAARTARAAWELDARLRRILATASLRGTLSVRDSATTRAGTILAIRVCKQGDTPQNVSQRYYGTPDHGVDVLRSNRLPWMTPSFYSGQVIVIPSLNAAASPKG